jgi:predicted transcriptional regulator
VYDWLLREGNRQNLEMVVIFDECKLVFGKEKESQGFVIDFLKQVVTQGRGVGLGLILANQDLELSNFIRANVYTQVCFHLVSPSDIRTAAFSMGCNEQQRAEIIRLRIPYAIVKIPVHPYPFKIAIPKAKITRHITDAEIEKKMEPILSSLSITSGQKQRPQINLDSLVTKKAQIVKTEAVGKALEEWIRFLKWVRDNPGYNISTLYDSMGLSRRRGQKVKNQLADNGLIEVIKMQSGERKRPPMYLRLTEKGEEYLNERL